MNKSRLLMKEHPVVINKDLACVIGLNEAIVLQQIEYWININEKARKESSLHKGDYWTYNTIEEWNKQFPFWSYDTVRRTLKKLRDKEILITGNFNIKKYDKTLWYRIDYKKLDSIENESIVAKCHNEKTSRLEEMEALEKALNNNIANCHNAILQNATMEYGKMHLPIPEINKEINTETIYYISSSSKKKYKEEEVITPVENRNRDISDIESLEKLCLNLKVNLKKNDIKILVKSYDLGNIERAILTITATNAFKNDEIKNHKAYLIKTLNDFKTPREEVKNITVNNTINNGSKNKSVTDYTQREDAVDNYAKAQQKQFEENNKLSASKGIEALNRIKNS